MRLGDLPINAMVKESVSGTMFLVAAKDHLGYEGAVTLITERLVGVGCFDAAEKAKPQKKIYIWDDVQEYGSSNYGQSNIHQWLNADRVNWFGKTHQYDEPPAAEGTRYGDYPYDQKPGFLTRFPESFKNRLIEMNIPTLERVGKLKGELRYVAGKVFLPSRTEIGKGDEIGIPEGKMLPIFYNLRMYRARPTDEDRERYGRSWNPSSPGNPEGAPISMTPHGAGGFLPGLAA